MPINSAYQCISLWYMVGRGQRRKNDTKEDAVGRTDQNGISSRARQTVIDGPKDDTGPTFFPDLGGPNKKIL